MRKHTLCDAVATLTKLLWRSALVDFGALLVIVAAATLLAVIGIDTPVLVGFATSAGLIVAGLLALALVATAIEAALDEPERRT
jgi:hypothetical protein